MRKPSIQFALIGAAGYIAPRHVRAIADTGSRLVAAVDPHDCVGYLDQYFPDAQFFTEIERFDRFLEKRRRGEANGRIDYVSICSPNYLHDAHVRLALRVKAHAICEKPLVLSPWNLDALRELEVESGKRVFTVLQLRFIPQLIQLRESIHRSFRGRKADVCLSYVTRRGAWYRSSWKGSPDKSGGIAMNIGVHFFDLLLWLFGSVESSRLHLRSASKMAGVLHLDRARVRWFLSTDVNDLPDHCRAEGHYAHRQITIDGHAIDFSHGFTDLHSRVYQETLEGNGVGIEEARPAISLIHEINQSDITLHDHETHPALDQCHTPSDRAVDERIYQEIWRQCYNDVVQRDCSDNLRQT